jgi:hypothetical protein
MMGLFTFANFSQYTGIEHTRISELLVVLAGISIVMWAAVCLSIVARIGAKLLMKYSQKNKNSKKDIQVG